MIYVHTYVYSEWSEIQTSLDLGQLILDTSSDGLRYNKRLKSELSGFQRFPKLSDSEQFRFQTVSET